MIKYFMILIPLVFMGCDQTKMNQDRQAQRNHEIKMKEKQNQHELIKFQQQEELRWENEQIIRDKEIAARLKEQKESGIQRQKSLEESNRTKEVQQNQRRPVIILVALISGIAGFFIYSAKKKEEGEVDKVRIKEEGEVHKVRIKEEEATTRRKVDFLENSLEKLSPLSSSERKKLFEGFTAPALTYSEKKKDEKEENERQPA